MNLVVCLLCLIISMLIIWGIVWFFVSMKPYVSVFSATSRWHRINEDGLPLAGIPVLTEYENPHFKYHGFRVDTYSTKLGKWMEAEVWDQKVIAYAEIKPHRHKERMKSGSVADGTWCVECGQDMEPSIQWPRK
jgi:hypothetical protein